MGRKRKVGYPIYIADFETTSMDQYEIEGETRVYLWEMKDKNNVNKYLGVDIESFFNQVFSLNESMLCFFHNLSFDGEFILWYLIKNGFKDVGKIDSCNPHPLTMETIITDLNAIFMIKIVSPQCKIIEFRCSYKIFPNSIKEIGKMVGCPKLDETHNYDEIKHFDSIDEVSSEELMYLENDVEILRRLIEYLDSIQMLNISMATNCYKYWKKDKFWLVKNYLVKSTDERVNTAIEKSYRGAITMVNKKYQGKLLENVISYDVNSLYPSVMLDYSMPVGEGKYYETIEECNYPKRLIGVNIIRCEVREGMIPVIGVSKGAWFSNSYAYEDVVESKILYMWEEEYNLFKLIYEGIYNVFCCIGFKEQKEMFKDYIDYWAEQKMKADPNSPQRQFSKLSLNSLYGKFGMNSLRYSKKPIGIDGEHIKYEIDTSETFYYYKAIASYICCMARCKLINAILCNLDRFVYCDTDSIYLLGWELCTNIPVDDKKFGYWKFEHYYNHFKALKAKCYLKDYTENGEVVYDSSIAGLPRDARGSITYDNFEDGLEIIDAKKCKCKVKGGIVIGKVGFKIRV